MTQIKGKTRVTKLKDYAELIDNYLSNEISVLDFEQKYLETFKEDETIWVGEEFTTLNDLFSDVDAFCHDPKIRSSEDLDEIQLKKRAEIALSKINKLLI